MVEGGAVLPNDDTEIMLLLSSTRRAISHHVKRTFSSHQLKNIIEVESAYREEDDDMSEANSLDYASEMESDGQGSTLSLDDDSEQCELLFLLR